MPSYDHLKIDSTPILLPFSGGGGGGDRVVVPTIRNRPRHAQRLLADLEAVVAAKASLHDAELPPADAGVHLTATARTAAGVQASGKMLDVLSIKGDGEDQRVNLFIRNDDIDAAKRRIERYGAAADGASRINNFALFESAARFTPTQLEDLWTDPIARFPDAKSTELEWELWVRAQATTRLRNVAGRYGVACEPGQADFPSVSMVRVRARADDLERLIDATSAVLELRACSSMMLETLGMRPSLQRALARDLASHIVAPPQDAPRICILDTGVMASHPLLAPALAQSDCLTLNTAWDAFGWHPHGTRVAGLALYRDLAALLHRPRRLPLATRLESVVVLRPDRASRSRQEANGEVVAAVNAVERAGAVPRVFCLASSDTRGLNDGVPTKLSGIIDQLASGLNGAPRLFCVAAGNLADDPVLVAGYCTRNEASGIGSPGQAMNALTVGGCTFHDEHPHGGDLLCPPGDLSASARTSTSWVARRAIKPDLVFEAGNIGLPAGEDETACEHLAELNRLTTNNSETMLLGTLGETSAATAAVAGMAGRLMARYPDYWPETIRGLLVHSAAWTPAMVARGRGDQAKDRVEHTLTMFGWGVPDEDCAAMSASDRLTLVIQGTLAPFKIEDGDILLNQCAYHALPWPVTALEALGSTEVEARITLSYFVQPDMRAASTRRYLEYPSHRLAFDLKGPDDDDLDFMRRQNRAQVMRGAKRAKPPTRSERNWSLGPQLRERGTIHHDVWTGPAEELARQNAVRVTPRGGWWSEAPDYAGLDVRYALIVSIRTPEAAQDLVQEAQTRIPALQRTRIRQLEPFMIQPVTVPGR